MSSRPVNAIARLHHIRENIVLARRFVDGLDYADFRDNRLVFYAVTRALEIISEASRGLPDDVRMRHPALPWREIAGAGNVYRHDYEDVRQSLVWGTLTKHFQPLLEAVEDELRRLGEIS